MNTITLTALSLVMLSLALLLVRAITWRALVLLIRSVSRLPELAGSRGWARLAPVHTWLQLRHPRISAILSARFSPDRFPGLPLTLLIVAGAYLAAMLGGLAQEVIEAGSVLRFDQAVNDAFAPLRVPGLVAVFRWITALGAGPALTAVALTGSGFLWAHGRRGYILPLWLTFLGAQATTWPGKFLINRHRPDFIPGLTEVSPSFPSGHATASTALFCFIAYAIARDLGSRKQRFDILFWTIALVAVIGFSRVFLSVHFLTDVVAGFLVGSFWIVVGISLREWRNER